MSPGMSDLTRKLEHLATVVPSPDGRARFTNEAIARELARVGVTVTAQYIALLRNGQRSNPSASILHGLAEVFGVPIDYFFDDAREEKINAQLDALMKFQQARLHGLRLRGSGLDAATLHQLADLLTRAAAAAQPEPQPPEDSP